jgi:hypothetical protein
MLCDFDQIREGLRAFPASASQHASLGPKPEEIFFPQSHASALDLERTVVVGNRGAGKTFWAHALVKPTTRALIAEVYKKISANSDRAVFGFRGADAEDIAPSKELLARARALEVPDETIWRAVLMRAVAPKLDFEIKKDFLELVKWCHAEVEVQQRALRAADNALANEHHRLALVFDALDKLGDSWSDIRPLTIGLLRFALAAKSFRAIKIKIFMRPDQAQSRDLFSFPDSSKLINERVDLKWAARDLYGLLFFELLRRDESRTAMRTLLQLFGHYPKVQGAEILLPPSLVSDEVKQKLIFDKLAGPFMGSDATRGRTYSWVPLHLADANDETTPRVFLKALREAAYYEPGPTDRAIDHLGIMFGVQKASESRLLELLEDYPWVSLALQPLRGTEVPAEQRHFKSLWKKHNTAAAIQAGQQLRKWLAPLEFETAKLLDRDLETALMDTLKEIGVLEQRPNGQGDQVHCPRSDRAKRMDRLHSSRRHRRRAKSRHWPP